ncbi:hypothetical protein P3574_24750, partial [Vibrio parahaemolyticus]|nr:hypothetical protein [Vibrio parahaemolyticus]
RPPPPTRTNYQHSVTGAMAGVTVHGISQEAIDDFWGHNDQMSLRSNQKGLNYALEGYIHHFIVEKVDEKLKLQAKIYRSQCTLVNRIWLPSPSKTTS